jgi:hypothetical protein
MEYEIQDIKTPTDLEKAALDTLAEMEYKDRKDFFASLGTTAHELKSWKKNPGMMWIRALTALNPEITRMNAAKTPGAADFHKEIEKNAQLQAKVVELESLLAEAKKDPELERTYERRAETATQVAEPEEKSLWTGRDLMICSPMYRTTNPLTHFALMALFDRTKMRYEQKHGTRLVMARNQIAHNFLKSGCQWSFWLDDDMIPTIGNSGWWRRAVHAPAEFPESAAGVNIINRLTDSALKQNAKIMSAIYYGRNEFGRAMYAEAIPIGAEGSGETTRARSITGGGTVKRTAWCAMGCLLIHRDAFLAVAETLPKEQYTYDNPCPFFSAPVPTNAGEDQIFGRLAAAAGVESYVDFGAVAAHVGSGIWCSWNTREGIS